MTDKDTALNNEILRGVVGSTVHGTAIEGQDDRDEMGVFIEPPEAVCGLKALDHYIYRDQPDGVRSEPGDLDLTVYSLRRFCQLAEAGNPSILMLLWLPSYIKIEYIGQKLVEIRHAFVSRNAGFRFLGYLTSQRKRLTGELSRTVNRPELVEKYGYDTKFAMHALRLGIQGLELMITGNISLPVPEPELTILRNVRNGIMSYEEALELIYDIEDRLRARTELCQFRSDRGLINDFMVKAHREHWGWTIRD